MFSRRDVDRALAAFFIAAACFGAGVAILIAWLLR